MVYVLVSEDINHTPTQGKRGSHAEPHGRSKQVLPYSTLQHLKISLKNTERFLKEQCNSTVQFKKVMSNKRTTASHKIMDKNSVLFWQNDTRHLG